MNQPSLQFENKAPIAAKADPWTSKAAGRALTKNGKRDVQKRIVLEAMLKFDDRITSAELAEYFNLDRHMVARRLPDLERDGFVERHGTTRCAVSGRYAVAWRAK